MSGLLWEWTSSRYDEFEVLRLEIIRGGSDESTADELRCAESMFWDPGSPGSDIGFRCVMNAG